MKPVNVITETMKRYRDEGLTKERAVIAAQEELVVGWQLTDKKAAGIISRWLEEHEDFWG